MSDLLMPDEKTLSQILHEWLDYGHHDPSRDNCSQCDHNASVLRAEARRIQSQRERLAAAQAQDHIHEEVVRNLAKAWDADEPGLAANQRVDSIGD